MHFYTNVSKGANYIFYRGYDEDGQRVHERIKYEPTLFQLSKNKTKYQTIDGRFVEPIRFNSISEAKKYVYSKEGIDNWKIYGHQAYEYTLISDVFRGKIEADLKKVRIVYLDIETSSENSFPTPEDALEPIIAITLESQGIYYVFGCGEYWTNKKRTDIKYTQCKNEFELIEKFLERWRLEDPDVVSGWYIGGFDIPYIYNRLRRLYDDQKPNELSPWNYIYEKTIFFKGQEKTQYVITGISTLDYIDLFQKYAPHPNQESYKLNHIAHVILGEKKISYDEYGSIQNLYKENYQKFIDYNIQDVALVKKLENKMKLIELVMSIAYMNKVNYVDVYQQVRMWNTIIFNRIRDKNQVIPPKVYSQKKQEYRGAFVKNVSAGFFRYVVSFDLNSLYPNIMALLNISPDTICPEKVRNVDIEALLNKEIDTSYLKEENLALAANGQHFSREKQGLLPEILMEMYEERKIAKKNRLAKESELQLIKAEMKSRGMK